MGKLMWFQDYKSYSFSLKRLSENIYNIFPLVDQVGRQMNKAIEL